MDETVSPMMMILRRLVPSTMGARLVLSAAVIAVTTTIVTLSINATLVNAQADAWTRSDVSSEVAGFRSFLDLNGQRVAAAVGHIRDDRAFRELFASGDGPALRRLYESRLLKETESSATVGLDAAGRILFSNGSDADIAHLRALVAAHDSAETTGLIKASGGVAVVYGAPVMGADGTRRVGYVIVARLEDAARLARFDMITRGVVARFHEPGYRPDGIALRPAPAAGPAVEFGSSAAELVTVADLPAADGGIAGTIELRNVDPRGLRTASVTGEASVLAGLAAGLIGLGLGLWMAGIMRRPVDRMIRHTRRRAQLAARGDTTRDEAPAPVVGLPREFQALGAVIDDLVRHLDERRSDLETAARVAQYAEETLSVVVNEAIESKVVIQDDAVVIVNPAASEALGTPANQLIGRSAATVLADVELHTEDGAPIAGPELIERALDERTTVSLALPGGSLRWYEVDAVRHADDRHDRLLLSARDVTEERRIASIRAEIISLVGHDLRSPLTVVIGYLDLLQRPMTDAERIRALDAARRNAARMADLLEDLLTATRAEELLAPSDLVPTSLVALAEEVVASLGPTHSERPLLLESDCDPIVLGEEKRLRQVLVNLVTNAYKYSPDPEPIVVRVRCDEKTAFLEVIDHGPGIPADDRDHVFERFARLRGGEGRTGVGLGLYIVSIIAHNHGGSVRIDETPGGGATFVVELPLVGTMIDGEFVL